MSVENDALPVGQEHRSLDRLIRMFARFVSTGYLVYFVLLLPELRRTAYLTSPWWTWFCVIAVFGSGIVFGVVSFSKNITLIRYAGSLAALTYLVAALSWWFAWDDTLFDKGGNFLSAFPGLATLAAATVWPPIPVFIHLGTALLSVQLSNYVLREPFMTNPFVADLLFGIMFCTIFVAATLAALRTARILDATISRTQDDAAGSAAAEARAVERERFDALIHDGVMSSLLSVTRQGRTQSVVKQARSTLHQLDSLRANSTPTVVDMTEAIAQLRAAATDIDDSVTVVIDADRACDGDEPPTYPSDAVRAIGAALAEALRNSILHAGAAEQSVTIAARPGSLRVSVVDDGVGFDQSAVPPHRLGVAVSIRGRLRQLSGGSSHIISSPGTGTTVQLAWHDGAVT
nr:ATP-binding protein [Rhodococcus sp. (in: high G+C Gram-positive bacteria)]